MVKSSVYPGHILKVGTLDNSVRLVQEKLKIKADKIFGPTTENAVKDFQKNNV
ncbi:peptidoglycan-binding domain-containing protein [Bacillus sp. AFS055030]|uniref:peptidoglycan-binding domain-containing protein n=1 Tax=Bacillus sp. AFS055030 TaxID=2033507 RepID=UPI0015D48740|nr:peptidoglycan-binding domain-containing protein [Bacillus sp. AFS055030]